MSSLSSKIIHFKDITANQTLFRDKKTVLVGGCYDIFHYGHLTFLRKAKEYGDELIIALESDQFIKKNKKRTPVHNQTQRAEILASLSLIDVVILLPFFASYNQYEELVKLVKPEVVAITKGDIQLDNKEKQVTRYGGRVIEVTPLIKHYSSSTIIHDEIIFGR